MADPTPDLQFEHATYEAAPRGVRCGMCGQDVGREYWQWLGRVACSNCTGQVAKLEAKANSPGAFARAAVLGTVTALACGVGYAIVVGIIHVQFALITIGIAYAVATVIRKQTGNVSGRRYQILAVALTYLASTMGYAPDVWRAAPQGIGSLLGYLLIAPFLSAKEAPIGLLIIGFGLYEAWRRSKGLPMAVTGPFRVRDPGGAPSP